MYSLPPASQSAAPEQPIAAAPTPEIDVGTLFHTLVRRRKIMLLIFAVFVGLIVLLTYMQPKSYTTSIKLIAGTPGGGSGGGNSDLPVLNAFIQAAGVQSAETYAELFREYPVAQQVVNDLHLKASPGTLLAHIEVTPVSGTSILTLSVTWSDAAQSAAIANAFGKVVVDRERQLIADEAQSQIDFLQKQIPLAEAKMKQTASDLATFEADHRVADINLQTQQTIALLSSLDARIGQLIADERAAKAQLATVSAQLATVPQTIQGSTTTQQNPVLMTLRQQLAQVDVQLQAALKQFTENHPTVVNLKNEETQLRREIAKSQTQVVAGEQAVANPLYESLQEQAANYRTQASSDAAQIGAVRAQIAQTEPQLKALPATAAHLAQLQRAAQAAQDVYAALQKKNTSAEIARSTALSDVTITQPAIAALASVKPSLVFNTVLGIAFGLVIAIIGVFVVDFFDRTARNDREVVQELALPLLGSIPLVRMKDGEPALPWVKTLTIESFIQLVTAIKYSSDAALRTIAVTSAAQDDGKSMVSLNVALAMAELQPRVLLVDADLRRPSLHAKLQMRNQLGLSDVLVGQIGLREVIQPSRYGGLDILSSGTPAPNPIKLLQSQRFDELLREALDVYRCVIVDTSALSINLDSAVLARKCDGTLMVVSAGQTDIRAAKNAVDKLYQVGVRNVLGCVLNRVEPKYPEYAGYIGYGNLKIDETLIITD
ncbi:MAG: GumC family protein [Vulcanimicrobiaceae bacterium]